MMTEDQAVAYIHSAGRFSGTPGLSRIEALMERLGNPQNRLKCIHIAGTNGKGSTAAMTAAVLRAAGYRVGLYTSPFLENFRERIRIDGEMIVPDLLAALTVRVRDEIEALTANGMEPPGEFEIITAIAFCAFAQAQCDLTVLEVGLGGKFDATNVIAPPLVSSITSISLDHTRQLGDTVSKIAAEKCGILKTGSRAVVSMDQNPQALAVIMGNCAVKDIDVTVPDPDALTVDKIGLDATEIEYRGQKIHIPLLGMHQVNNALTAMEIVNALRRIGYGIPQEAAAEGIRSVSWPGRLELLSRSPFILLDTAHNPGGMGTLIDALRTYFPSRRLVTVMGMFSDKDYAFCIPMIARRSEQFIAVAPDSPRALCEKECAAIAKRECGKAETAPDLPAAIERGLILAGSDGLLLICGSISIVGRARTYLYPLTKDGKY